MKRKVIIGIFSAIILLTVAVTVILQMVAYVSDKSNGDKFAMLGLFMLLVIGVFCVLYELELFYTVYYFFLKPRTFLKSVLNVLSTLSLTSTLAYTGLPFIIPGLRFYEIIPCILFAIYVVLRCSYLVISQCDMKEKS